MSRKNASSSELAQRAEAILGTSSMMLAEAQRALRNGDVFAASARLSLLAQATVTVSRLLQRVAKLEGSAFTPLDVVTPQSIAIDGVEYDLYRKPNAAAESRLAAWPCEEGESEHGA